MGSHFRDEDPTSKRRFFDITPKFIGATWIRGKVTAEKEKCKMKMKTTKFLAVLAVLAFAFAAFAVAAYPEADATGDNTIYISVSGNDETGEGTETNPYATLPKAMIVATDGDTIKLLTDYDAAAPIGVYIVSSEVQIAYGEGKSTSTLTTSGSLTIDFDGHYYEVSGAVGSTGTETQAFHIEKGPTMVFENGTLKAKEDTGIKMLFHNYTALTLTDMVLDGTNTTEGSMVAVDPQVCNATLVTNNGAVTIDGNTKVIAPVGSANDNYAVVVNWWPASYSDGTQVVLNTTGYIEGVAMTLDSGTIGTPASTLEIKKADIRGDIYVAQSLVSLVEINVSGELTIAQDEIVTIDGDAKVTLSADASIVMEDGAILNGTVSYTVDDETSSVELDTLTAGTNGLTITTGSVYINGEIASGDITVTGVAKISGKLSANIDISDATLIVPTGETLVLDGITITGTSDSTIKVLGSVSGTATVDADDDTVSIEAANPDATASVIGGDVEIESSSSMMFYQLTGDSEADIEAILGFFEEYEFVGIGVGEDANDTYAVLEISTEVAFPGTLYIGVGNDTGAGTIEQMTAGFPIVIEITEDGELTVDNAKIYDASSTMGSVIVVEGSLILDAADVCTIVTVDDEGYVNVMNPLRLDATGTPTSDLSVGYGNTLTINKVNVPNGKEIYVYGNLVVEGANTVAFGGKIITYNGSTMTVNGSIAVEGSVTTAGITEIDGSVTVYRAGGYASWTDSGFTAVYGSFDVTKARQDGAGANTLTVYGDDDVSPYTTGFYLFGTSNISGTLSGKILDYGTMTFNGTSNDAEVEVRAGVTFNVNSVAGTLTVTDEDAAIDDTWDITENDYKEYVSVFDGNMIELTNVKGMSITETVTVTVGKVTHEGEEKTVKYYSSVLSITGTSAVTDKDVLLSEIEVCGGAVSTLAYDEDWSYLVGKGYVDVDDITLGKNTILTFTDDGEATFVTVSGTVTAVSEDAGIYFINSAGLVKVEGQIFVNNANNAVLGSFAGMVSATYYEYDSLDGSTNFILEPFEEALDKVLTADDSTIFVYGSQKVAGITEIPASGNVQVTANSTLSIGSDAVLTIAADGVLDSTAGTLTVDGILIVTDKDTGLRYNTGDGRFVYQVRTENGQTITYSGIAGALLRASPGDIITMVQDGYLYSDATIPAGVTLIIPNGKTLTLGYYGYEMTFTVDGMLVLERTASTVEATGADVTIIDNGAILQDKDATFTPVGFEMDNYVYFAKKIEGRTTTIYSNLTFAAATIDGGALTVVGKVKATDIIFAADSTDPIIITIANDSGTAQNGIAVNSMTLVNSKVIIGSGDGDNSGIFTGTIIAGSETGDAAITLNNATGMTIFAVTEETAAGDVDHFYISLTTNVTYIDGTTEITAGTVTMNGNLATKAAKSSVFKVGENAIFVVASGKTFTVASVTSTTNVTVAGLMIVNGTLDVNGQLSVSGILTVVKSKSGDAALVDIDGNTTVTGSVIVSEDTTLYGKFYVNSAKLTLGKAATSIGAGASFVGPVDITSATAYIIVYPNADISDAKIDWNALTESSDAVSTTIYVYDTLYATVFADSSTTKTILKTAITSSTKITGYDVKTCAEDADYWYTDSALKTNMSSSATIGSKTAVYFAPALAMVTGTVTVGTGIDLYVDGKVYTPEYGTDDEFAVGTHTVSVQIKTGYVGDNVTIKFNGTVVPATATGGSFTITADMESFTLVADGATPYTPEPTPEPEKESEWTVTTILLCVLVVLIAIMAVIVALRLNRN